MLTRSAARLFSTESLKVVNNVAKQQFTVSLGGSDAVIGYEQKGKAITFVRTDVPPVFQGKGVGKILAKYAFDHANEHNLDVTCQCHFLAKYFENNRQTYKNLKITFDIQSED